MPTTSTKDNSVPDNDFLKEFDCEDDILRLNRLKHFISVSNLPGKHYYDHDYQDDTGSDYNHKDDVLMKYIHNHQRHKHDEIILMMEIMMWYRLYLTFHIILLKSKSIHCWEPIMMIYLIIMILVIFEKITTRFE